MLALRSEGRDCLEPVRRSGKARAPGTERMPPVQLRDEDDSTIAGFPESGIFTPMSTLTEIEAAVEMLPRPQQETLLRHLAVKLGGAIPPAFSIATEADGLPVIRAQGGVITSSLVREIEGLVR